LIYSLSANPANFYVRSTDFTTWVATQNNPTYQDARINSGAAVINDWLLEDKDAAAG
jgi:hypothetical protein